MDAVKGWKKKPAGEKERFARQLDYSLNSCINWLKYQESSKVSVVCQDSTFQPKQTKEPIASTSNTSTKVNTYSKKLKEVSNESQWLRDFSNKYFYDSSDDEEDGHSVQSSSSSSYDGYGSDSYEDRDETVRDNSEGDAVSDYGSESEWNSDHSSGDN